MVEIAARRFTPARPPNFGHPPPGPPVMGDPLSVPEAEMAPYPAEPDDPDPEPLWLKLPPHLAPYFDLGFCHTEDMCPYVVLRARDDTQPQDGTVEVGGPPSAFLELAEVIVALCQSVPCISHDARGEAPRRAAG